MFMPLLFLAAAIVVPVVGSGLYLRKTRYGQLLVLSGLLTLLPFSLYGIVPSRFWWPERLWLPLLLPAPWLALAMFALFAYGRRGVWFLAGLPVVAFVWLMQLYFALCVPTKSCL